MRALRLILSLLFGGIAAAAQITNVSGAAWAASGTATAGSTGFSVLSAGWTHLASSNVPLGSSATGYIQTVADAGGTFQLDASSAVFNAVSDYWLSYNVLPHRTATALAADASNVTALSFVNAGTKLSWKWYVRNNAQTPGLAYNLANFLTGGTPVASILNGSNTSLSPSCLAFEKWHEVTFHVNNGNPTGLVETYINGVLCGKITGLPVGDTAQIPAATLAVWTIQCQAIAGVQWYVSGPVTSNSGSTISLRPKHARNESTADLGQWHPARWVSTSALDGYEWITGGTATATTTAYATGGANPMRSRTVFSGASTTTATQNLIDNVGTLPFNAYGVATVEFPMTYMPSGGTCSWKIMNAGNSSALIQLDYDGTNIKQGSTTLFPMAAADRVALMVHMKNDGTATASLCDETLDDTQQIWWSAALPTAWTVGAVGQIQQSAVLGSAAVEMDGVAICRWADFGGVDSLTGVTATGLTPLMYTRQHVMANMQFGTDADCIPGGAYTNYFVGGKRAFLGVILGRPGRTLANWWANAGTYMTQTTGLQLLDIDLASVNDSAGVTDQTSENTALAAWRLNMSSIRDKLVAGKNKIILSTGIIRSYNGVYNSFQQDMHAQMNAWRSGLAMNPYGGLVLFSPVQGIATDLSYLTGGDGTHFTAAGDTTYAQYFYQVQTILRPNDFFFFSGMLDQKRPEDHVDYDPKPLPIRASHDRLAA